MYRSEGGGRSWMTVLGLTFFVMAMTVAGLSQVGTADLILHNGFIWTVDESKPRAEAVAIRGEKIIRVGTNAEVL
ncbi:MAG TPA: hypothetical protein DEA22_07285, partial [Blastocatellia bacterium]|nr:hypothetical protein [Blastocatellia bacterium]